MRETSCHQFADVGGEAATRANPQTSQESRESLNRKNTHPTPIVITLHHARANPLRGNNNNILEKNKNYEHKHW